MSFTRGNKYGNKQLAVEGKVFSSQKEGRRYQELRMLERAGKIVGLGCQVPYPLIPKQAGERAVIYIADFVYRDSPGEDPNTLHVEDTKGFRTRDYIIKRKLMLWIYGIKIEEM